MCKINIKIKYLMCQIPIIIFEHYVIQNLNYQIIVSIGVSAPSKTPLPSWQTVQAPLFRQSPMMAFRESSKNKIFQKTSKILNPFILNPNFSFKSN